jgi:hypothetical protein
MISAGYKKTSASRGNGIYIARNPGITSNILYLTPDEGCHILSDDNPSEDEMADLTHARLLEVMEYTPETGVFHWLVSPGPRTGVGAKAGHKGPGGRPVVEIDGKLYYLARLAWFYVNGRWPVGLIVPADGDKTNVRLANLIERSPSELRAASGPNSLNTSGVKGVSWNKAKAKWCAMITRNGVQYNLGWFVDKDEAAAAYRHAAETGELPAKGSKKSASWATDRRQRSAPWKAIQENPRIVGWETIEQFIADVGEPPTTDHMLMRAHYDQPLGPGNAVWRLQWAKRPGHDADPEKSYNLMQFDISVEEYDRLFFAQEGLCAICSQPERAPFKGGVRRLAVDHDHETGKVRGLLCMNCNNGLGRFGDDPGLLRAAADYLDQHAGAAIVPIRKDSA